MNRPVAVLTTLAAGILLCGRRRWPVVCSVGACLLVVVRTRIGVPEDQVVVSLALIFTACFALGRYADLVAGLVGLVVVDLAVHESDGLEVPGAQDVLWVLTLTAGPWLAGRLVAAHERRGEELTRQAHQLVVEQRQLSERVVADERRRLARELHDIIAHSLSVMVVQAGAASDLLRRDPDAAQRALTEIQRAGRSALGETGRLLHLLREDADSESGPQPAAGDLPASGRGLPFCGSRRRAGHRRVDRRAARWCRPVDLPHRPGGTDQCAQARATEPRRGHGPPRT